MRIVSILLFSMFGAFAAAASPTIGSPSVTPGMLVTGTATQVTASCQISTRPTDPPVVAGSVNLIRIDALNKATNLGAMHDNGNGLFSYQYSETQQAQFGLQCSAAFRGVLMRVKSPVTAVQVIPGCTIYTNSADHALCQSNSVIATPTLAVRVSGTQDGANQPILSMPPFGSALVYATAIGNQALNAAGYDWQQVAPVINSFATTGTATFSAAHTTGPHVTITLPSAGIYQFQATATATDGKTKVSTYFWVNAWDNKTAVGPGNIGRNPGVAAPTSVRMLTADPGPFKHPRLLFTKGDWPTLSANASPTTGLPETQAAIAVLTNSLNKNFDKAGTALNNLATALTSYASNGYLDTDYTAICTANGFAPTATGTPTVPAIFKSTVLGNYTDTQMSDALAAASYLGWLAIDPSNPPASGAAHDRMTHLATLTAAYAHFLLTTEFKNTTAFTGANSGSLANYSLALAYDLTYDYMTPSQQADTRSYLFTIGNLYNYCCGGISLTPAKTIPAGSGQNGVDFPNLADGIIQPAMVIEGEESTVLSSVTSRTDLFGSYISAASSTDKAVTAASSWPYASQVSVRNMGRQVRANSEYILTPWGFYQNMEAYFQLGQNVASPGALAYARRGENQWVTTNLYQSMLHPLYNIAPKEAAGTLAILDPHDGAGFAGGDGQRNFYYVAKYMYPDDPLIDYIYRQATAGWNGNALAKAIFGSALLTNTMSQVAQAKQLGLTKFDPLVGFAISRNGWNEGDLALVMNNFTWGGGHYHAQANAFALFAQGRIWANPPGYHVVPGDAQSQVLIQLYPSATDASQGYVGQGPGSYDYATDVYNGSDNPGGPFHGVLLDVTEDPSGNYTWFSGDSGPAYGYVSGTPVYGNGQQGVAVSTGLTPSQFLIPGLTGALIPSDAQSLSTSTRYNTAVGYNPVRYAYRGILTVRGATPYVLVIDDINKDGTNPYNYRWSINNSIDFGPANGIFLDANHKSIYSSLELTPGATATDAILYHDIDAANTVGNPRLLVRDLSENNNSGQPAIQIEDRPIPATGATPASNLTYGYDNNSKQFTYFNTRRLFIERRNVVEPKYKVLLYPFGYGAALPVTSWDSTKSVLTVTIGNQTDTITFDNTQADHRTRLKSFARAIH